MAVVTGLITINNKQVLEVDSAPGAAAGTAAPIGSLAMFDNGSLGVLYFKSSAADTGWVTVDLSEGADWQLAGNALTGAGAANPNEVFGSTNDYDLVFKRNNSEQFRLQNNALLIGLSSSIGGRLQVGEAVADADMMAQIFNPTSNPVIAVSRMSRLATVGAASAQQDFAIPTDKNALIEVKVCARQTAGATGSPGDGASYVRTAHASNVGGAVGIFGSQTDYTYEVNNGMNLSLSASGAVIRATALGVTGRNISWGLHASILITGT